MDKENNRLERPTVEVRARGEILRIPDQLDSLSAADIQRLIYDLAVHQVELEAQNEQLRRADELIEMEQARYRDLFMQAPVGYLTLNNQHLIIDMNGAAQALLGFSHPLPPGQQFTNFIKAADLWRFHKHTIQAYASGQVETCELQLVQPQGGTIWVQAAISAIPLHSGSTGEQLRVSLLDISDRKRSEEQTEQLNDGLSRLSAELTAANREVEVVSHTIARELQEPLRVLEVCSGKLEAVAERNTIKQDVMRVREAWRQISSLLDELLHLTRIGHSPFRHGTVDLTKIAHMVVAEFQQADPDRRVTVTVADHLNVQGDKRLLEMVMAKLIDNAWKFTDKQPEAHIEVGATSNRDQVAFFVRDNGIGFDMKHAANLFKPFQRLPSGEGYPGRGFGLTMVSRIIRRHGGSVWAEASPGKGATFYFTLGAPRK